MKQTWEIWLRGGRKGYTLQKLERLFDKKAFDTTESSQMWDGETINVLKFSLPVIATQASEALHECLSLGEKINPRWNISGVLAGEVTASGDAESFEMKDIISATWKLEQ